jgi:hypothetical protein
VPTLITYFRTFDSFEGPTTHSCLSLILSRHLRVGRCQEDGEACGPGLMSRGSPWHRLHGSNRTHLAKKHTALCMISSPPWIVLLAYIWSRLDRTSTIVRRCLNSVRYNISAPIDPCSPVVSKHVCAPYPWLDERLILNHNFPPMSGRKKNLCETSGGVRDQKLFHQHFSKRLLTQV